MIVQKERNFYSVLITYFLKAYDCLKYLTEDAFVASFFSMCAGEQKIQKKTKWFVALFGYFCLVKTTVNIHWLTHENKITDFFFSSAFFSLFCFPFSYDQGVNMLLIAA